MACNSRSLLIRRNLLGPRESIVEHKQVLKL